MNLGAVFCVDNLTCSFHMLHTWPTQFYVGPPTLTFLATLVVLRPLFQIASSRFGSLSVRCGCQTETRYANAPHLIAIQ